MHWSDPGYFPWLWGGLGLGLLLFLVGRQRQGILNRFGDTALVEDLTASLSRPKRLIKEGLLVLALLFLVVSLASPQLPGSTVLVKRKGLDIVIAVDVSMSMLAQDIQPTRLEKAKLELQDLVEKAEGDRIGIVAFAGEAFVQVPLTVDRSAVKLFLKTLDPSLIPTPGTYLENAIHLARDLFVEEETEHKVIVLLTDGEDQGSKPAVAARMAAKQGIKIFPIGIGTTAGEMIPLRGPDGKVEFKRDARGNIVVSKLDEKTLKEIARITGGTYYRSQKGSLEVERIYRDLRGLGEKETAQAWVIEYRPLYQIPLLAAFIVIFLEMTISERRRWT